MIRARPEATWSGAGAEHAASVPAAMARRASAYHRLMIRAGEKVRAQAARVDLFELLLFFFRDAQLAARPRIVDGLAVGVVDRVAGSLGTPEAAVVLHSFCLASNGCVAMLEQLHDDAPRAGGGDA